MVRNRPNCRARAYYGRRRDVTLLLRPDARPHASTNLLVQRSTETGGQRHEFILDLPKPRIGLNSGNMIRRDYILRMIEDFAKAIARIRALKDDQQLTDASSLTEEEFKRISGLDSESVLRLSETELLARLIRSESMHAVPEQMSFLTTLLREAGDIAVARERIEDGRACYLKGLHLLLDSLLRGEAAELPEFVPKVDEFVAALADSELPVQTSALLMEHYERTGQFAKAEDALFAILDAEPDNSAAVDFGISFYERLQRQDDVRLAEGNLPRSEVDAGLKELSSRKASV